MAIRRNIHYSAVMAAFWFLNGVVTIFMVPLLTEQGFSDSQTGILLAVRALSSVAFQPFYASVADKIVSRLPLKYMIAILVFLGMVCTAVHAWCGLSFAGAVVVFAGYGASINCISAMLDSMSVQYEAASKKVNYTLARAVGSLAWAVSSLGLGRLIQYNRSYEMVLYVQMISLILLLAIVVFMEVPYVHPSVQESKSDEVRETKNDCHSILYIFVHHPEYTVLLIAVTLIFLSQNIVMSYLINKIELVGGGTAELGTAQALLAIAEILVPLYYFKIRDRVGVDRVVTIALIFTVIRITVIYAAENVRTIYIAQAAQIMACMYWSGNVEYVRNHIGEGDRIKGQGILAATQNGFAVGLSSIIAGQMLTYAGTEGLYTFSEICAVVGLAILIVGNMLRGRIAEKNKRYLKREKEAENE